MDNLLVFIKELSTIGDGQVKRMSKSRHAPGELAGFPHERLDHGVGDTNWETDVDVTVQSTDYILKRGIQN